MSIIQTNQPNFFGNNGAPLANGYIYIGEANKSPIDYPQTVTITDTAGNEYTASQPLRTNSQGRIQYNGKPVTASTDTDYSILIQDSTQTDIVGGYIPIVSTDSSSDSNLGDYREYGLLLSDVKAIDANVGETVSSIGKLTVDDELGADWLVISNSGDSADDVDLIDFSNGRQGRRIRNKLQPQDNLDNLTDYDAARTSLDVYSKSEVIEQIDYEEYTAALDGDYTSGTATMVRLGRLVSVHFSSSTFPSFRQGATSVGFIPEAFRPITSVQVLSEFENALVTQFDIQSNGYAKLTFRDWDGNYIDQTDSSNQTITYITA